MTNTADENLLDTVKDVKAFLEVSGLRMTMGTVGANNWMARITRRDECVGLGTAASFEDALRLACATAMRTLNSGMNASSSAYKMRQRSNTPGGLDSDG